MEEQWKPVVGFEGYEVSDLGRVRCWRPINGQAKPPTEPRVLKPGLDTDGYLGVTLRKDCRSHTRKIHRLVLEAFVGIKPAGMETRHLNGVRSDNQLVNLTWGTSQENADDRFRHGTVARGVATNLATIDDQKALAIFITPGPYKELAELFFVSLNIVKSIKGRRTWVHMTNGVPSVQQWEAEKCR